MVRYRVRYRVLVRYRVRYGTIQYSMSLRDIPYRDSTGVCGFSGGRALCRAPRPRALVALLSSSPASSCTQCAMSERPHSEDTQYDFSNDDLSWQLELVYYWFASFLSVWCVVRLPLGIGLFSPFAIELICLLYRLRRSNSQVDHQ